MTDERTMLKSNDLDAAIMVDEGIVWGDASLAFFGEEAILTDSIGDSYCIGGEEDVAATYLSVIDGNTVNSDGGLNPSLNLQEDIHDEELVSQCFNNQQIVLCNVGGELYGVQMAEDEDGNLQKYQFQIR